MSSRVIGFSASLLIHGTFVMLFLTAGQVRINTAKPAISQAHSFELSMFQSIVESSVVSAIKPPDPRPEPAEKIETPPKPIEKQPSPAIPRKQNISESKPAERKPVLPEKPRVVKKTTPAKPLISKKEATLAQTELTEQKKTAINVSAQVSAESQVSEPAPYSDSELESLENDYKNSVRTAILKNRTFPRQARRKGLQGTVIVGFRIRPDGSIEKLAIIKSSGAELLDDAALDAVRKVSRFRLFPEPLKKNYWDFEIPVSFKLS